jgi:CysZ protein
MMHFTQAALRAIQSLPNRSLVLIILYSIALNALALAGIISGLIWLVNSTNWFGEWDLITDTGFTVFAVAFGYFIFPVFLPLIVSFFDTAIAEAIEREDYPDRKVMEQPFWPTLRHDIRFTLKAILLNIISLPLYLLPGANLVIYFGLNGYLLGTEFFNIVAGRYITPEEARTLRQRYGWQIIMGGVSIAVCATIPFLNLIAPIWGVAVMVHFFHAVQWKKDSSL